ncbi:uncharacterized protein (UPF0548 family) [Phycicoccus badiiscoriae]|uniref:Uncharacterized protein (UPF0548 family) n=1 Tax=Pedococcus badiiscoriae TaxID=642776 RepID=A0A852WK77_9MICO|nr:DUF1990 domain-containing protein [Pedococcus badiiscoriae]NYG05896.1 uncharacterized protein (UPF0548 family) [Pedococcus badiiscoriae]
MKLADLASLELTYAPRGLTLDGPLPAGYQHLEVERRLGAGDAAYRRACEAVMTFGAQRGVGLRPQTTAPRAAVGVEILSRLVLLGVPCRVVWTVEGTERTGFGYGTLEGHVESGEEGFLVERRGTQVYAVVRAYSRPGGRLMRLVGPVGRWLQHIAALGYLNALKRAAREDG